MDKETNNRRYYWLKLKEDFFTDKRIKKLRKLAGGNTYTIIYLKLLLLSLKENGKIYYNGYEENFAKELELVIDESAEDIAMTLAFLSQHDLIEVVSEDYEFYMTGIEEHIGSETASTRRSRKFREKQKYKKMLQCNTNATVMKQIETNSNGEKEKELEIDKDKDKDKEGEKENKKAPTQFYGEFKNIILTDEEYKNLKEKLENHLDIMINKLSRYIESSGKKYKNHYVTLLTWYEQDKEKLLKNNSQIKNSSNYEDSISI